MGLGKGQGEGHGETSGGEVAAGTSIVCICTVIFFCIGIPAIIVGGILMAIAESGSGLWTAGLAMIIISLLTLIVGIVLGILICAGVCGKKKEGTVVAPQQGPIIIANMQPGPGYQQQPYQQQPYQQQPYQQQPQEQGPPPGQYPPPEQQQAPPEYSQQEQQDYSKQESA